MKFIIKICVFLACSAHAYAELISEISYGRALSPKTGELLYSEKHSSVFSDGKLVELYTEYLDLKNKKFADLRSNFQIHPYLPNYKFQDSRFGREDGILNRSDGKTLEVFAKSDAKAKMIKKTFSFKKMFVSGQGLHAYIRENLDDLVKSKASVDIDFLIPMNQKYYNFEIKKMLMTEDKVVFKIKIKNWFLSVFAPYLKVTYELGTKRLLVFEGPSNINTLKNKTQNVRIEYSYKK